MRMKEQIPRSMDEAERQGRDLSLPHPEPPSRHRRGRTRVTGRVTALISDLSALHDRLGSLDEPVRRLPPGWRPEGGLGLPSPIFCPVLVPLCLFGFLLSAQTTPKLSLAHSSCNIQRPAPALEKRKLRVQGTHSKPPIESWWEVNAAGVILGL